MYVTLKRKGVVTVINRRLSAVFLFFGLLVGLFSGCSSASAPPVDGAEMEAIGNEFVTELNGVIPLRESDDALLELGTLTVIDDRTYYLDALDSFYEEYRVGGEAALTIIYRTGSFVVSRIVFNGATGYYYRYELNPADVKAINIEAQPVDEVTIDEKTTGDIRDVIVTLKRRGSEDISFTFGNIVEASAEETAE